jgi:hypothetical protein
LNVRPFIFYFLFLCENSFCAQRNIVRLNLVSKKNKKHVYSLKKLNRNNLVPISFFLKKLSLWWWLVTYLTRHVYTIYNIFFAITKHKVHSKSTILNITTQHHTKQHINSIIIHKLTNNQQTTYQHYHHHSQTYQQSIVLKFTNFQGYVKVLSAIVLNPPRRNDPWEIQILSFRISTKST